LTLDDLGTVIFQARRCGYDKKQEKRRRKHEFYRPKERETLREGRKRQ